MIIWQAIIILKVGSNKKLKKKFTEYTITYINIIN